MIRFHAASSGTTNTLNYFFDIWVTSQDLYILLIVYDWWSHTFILCFFFCFYIFVRCIFGVCYLWVTTKGDCWSSTEFPCNYCIKSQWPLTDVFLDTVTTILVVIWSQHASVPWCCQSSNKKWDSKIFMYRVGCGWKLYFPNRTAPASLLWNKV